MLEDLSKPSSEDIILIFLYNLERRLLEKENYVLAINEIITLVKHNEFLKHTDYLIKILLFVSIKWNDSYFFLLLLEKLNQLPVNQYSMIAKYYLKNPLFAKDVFSLIAQLTYINKRYLKGEPDLYYTLLEKHFYNYFNGTEYCFYEDIKSEDLPLSSFSPFLNYSNSLNQSINEFKIFDIMRYYPLIKKLKDFHELVHNKVKEEKRSKKQHKKD